MWNSKRYKCRLHVPDSMYVGVCINNELTGHLKSNSEKLITKIIVLHNIVES